jgi:hypothetical protein
VPPGRDALRPVLTGWFSEFESLSSRPDGHGAVSARCARWAARPTTRPATTARRGCSSSSSAGLTPERLREVSRHQSGSSRANSTRSISTRVIRRDRVPPPERNRRLPGAGDAACRRDLGPAPLPRCRDRFPRRAAASRSGALPHGPAAPRRRTSAGRSGPGVVSRRPPRDIAPQLAANIKPILNRIQLLSWR